jgi:hypothetical protein
MADEKPKKEEISGLPVAISCMPEKEQKPKELEEINPTALLGVPETAEEDSGAYGSAIIGCDAQKKQGIYDPRFSLYNS